MAAAMSATTFFGTGIPVVQAADDGWVGVEDLGDHSTEKPAKDEVVPSTNQYNYQKEELAAFCHFGPNTFNNTEWGNYGDRSPESIFTLTEDFDAETLVKAVKDAGFHKLIVTAKHHDGFCIWDSKYTDFDVAATNYQDASGQKDILAEISKACTDEDIDMGLYLSPWDVHDKSYGYYDKDGNGLLGSDKQPANGMTWDQVEEADVFDYNEYYNNQLIEILSNPKYGNNGHFVEVWMDGAKGGDNGDYSQAQNYKFEEWFATIQKYEGKKGGYDSDCMLFGAEAYTTVRWIGNENGIAGEDTWSKSRVDYDANTINSRSQGGYTLGWEDGNQWTVPEADARITSGWFWGPNKATPKSLSELANMYFNSVGHNSPLLLNIPPNNQGTVDQAILDRLAEFGQNIKDTFDANLAAAEGAEVFASNVRGNDIKFSPAKVTDGKDDTYWTTDDETREGSLLIDLGTSQRFDIVSIEEAIQNGQHINQYKVEYRSGNGDWTVLKEGVTIGAKRLIRTGAIRADQLRITVTAPEGKVPMISEVGVYKATKAFELPSSAPTGMEIIDIEDTNVSDGVGFDFGGSTWTAEEGSQFVNGTNRWTNAGGSLTFKFHGSKFYIVGTKDPKHGDAKITIDGEPAETVSTKADARATSQIWYTSPDLSDGDHTVTIEAVGGALGIEAAYVINNGGIGMIGIEQTEYTMNEDETMDVKIVRVGGSEGRVSALLTGNPGSAVQGDFDTTAKVVTLGPGETETTVPVTTTRANDGKEPVESRDFTIVLDTPSTGLILGFNDSATVHILDAEMMTKEKLQTLIDDVGGRIEGVWTGDYDAYASALAAAEKLAAQDSPDALDMMRAYQALEAAADAMTKRTEFSEDDPVVFPTVSGEETHVEAELLRLIDVANGEKQAIDARPNEDKSNGYWVNWFNNGDKIEIPYVADRTGTYTVTMSCTSGATQSNPNQFTVTGNKITADPVSVYSRDPMGSDMEVDFEITVTEAGEGVITLTADDANAPSIDKFVITPKTFDGPFLIDVSTTEGGTAEVTPAEVAADGSAELTITPDSGYAISKVLINSADVTEEAADGTYTISNVTSDTNVEVIFTFANYTEENRFEFPTAKDETKTLEAEHFIQKNTGDNEQWPLTTVVEDTGTDGWPSNGKYVDSLNQNDQISVPYYADKAGTYEVTVTYRSGSTTNKLAWATEPEGLIEGEGDNIEDTPSENGGEGTTKTVKFNITVTKPGPGVWTFTGPEGNSPRLDKFDIKLTDITAEAADKVALEIAIQDGNREAEKTDAFTPESIQTLKDTVAEAQKVFEDKNATQEQADNAVSAVNEAIDNLAPLTYEIKASVANGGGTVTASKPTVDRGESVDLTIVPDYGYEAVSIQVNNEVINSDPGTAQNPETEFYGPNGTYTISNITEDQTVVVTFEKTGYTETEEERFTFPTAGNTAELDAAKATLFNSGGNGEKWKLDVSTGAWTTGEGFINSMNSGDKICIPYTAEETGEYTVTVVYRSGSNSNGFSWSEAEGKIENGSVTAGANDSAGATHEKEFTMNVETAGDGILTIAAGASGAPQIDKLVISKAGTQPDPEEKYTVTASVKDNVGGTVSVDPTEVIAGNSATVTFTPAEGYKVGTVTVNDTATEVTGNSLTLSDITEDKEVIVTYELDYYTESNRFYLPTEVNGASKTVQAEHFILQDNNDGSGAIREGTADWAEGGIFVNYFNNGDSIVLNYFAQKAGTYEFVMRYQSGSATNGISWSGDNITPGSLTLDGEGEADDSSNMSPKTKTFEVEITKEGEGQLIISAGAGNAPQVDQFKISLTEETGAATVNKDALKQAIDAATAKLKDETFTQESRDELAEAIKTAQGVFEAEDATQEQVNEQTNLLNNFQLVKAPVTYTVRAEEVANGSITLTGDAEDGIVEEGQDAAYTVTADSGYVIDTLTVNGAEVAEAKGLETYSGTVADVNANVTIAATFKLKDSGTITNKKDLYDAIEEARAILKQTDKYTAASLEEYGKIIDAAYAVYESDNADADDIAAAIKSLKDGLSVLVEQGGGTTDPGTPGTGDDKPGTGSGGDSSGNGKPQGGSGSGKDTVKAAQTGDDTNVMIWIIALAAAAAAGGAVLVIRKRSTR